MLGYLLYLGCTVVDRRGPFLNTEGLNLNMGSNER
jgi:hypothetical protein